MTASPRDGGARPERGRGGMVSIIVPAYREAENIPELAERIGALDAFPVELIIVDDDSGDGTAEAVRALDKPWLHLISRRSERGLSSAVLAGLARASGDVFVVMDADLSHPPESIPALVGAVDAGAEMAIGSRHVTGGSIDEGWRWTRRLNSGVAAMLARPLTKVRDPMSGFFALPRSVFQRGLDLNPTGYKIGLELLVKCRCAGVVEVPIRFMDRRRGTSKLTVGQQLLYVEHVRRLMVWKWRQRRRAQPTA